VSRKLKLWAGFLGLALLLGALSPLHQRFVGRHKLRFPYLARPLDGASYASLAAKPGWAKAQVAVAAGITLRGLLRRPTAKTSPWILFYPGNDESQLDRGQAFLSRLGANTDFGLAVFAYRGYDASDGDAELAGIRSDAPELLAKLCLAEGVAASQVHIVGFSIGGHFAVHAVAAAAARGQRAASLTLLASVSDIVMYQRSPWEKLSPGENYQTLPYLEGVPAPVLVIQGTADSAFHGPGPGRAIAAALGKRARYEELEGVDHVPLQQNERALELVRNFVLEHAH